MSIAANAMDEKNENHQYSRTKTNMKLAAVKLVGTVYMFIVLAMNYLTFIDTRLQLAVLHDGGHSMAIAIPELWQGGEDGNGDGQPDVGSVKPDAALVILETSNLRTACLTGSLMGAFLAICVWPSDGSKDYSTQVRVLGIKFIASAISGVMGTPLLARWAGLTIDVDWLVGAAGGVAFVSVAVLHRIAPKLLDAAVRFISGKIPGGVIGGAGGDVAGGGGSGGGAATGSTGNDGGDQ